MKPRPLLLASLWLGLAGACNQPQSSAPATEFSDRVDFSGGRNDAPGEPRYGGILRWAERAEPTSLDPARAGEDIQSTRIAMQIFEGLLTYDADLHLVPGLAQSWQVEAGGHLYRFKLRPRATFHDDPCFPSGRGRAVVAKDVRYSLARVLDPRTLCSQAPLLEEALYGTLQTPRTGQAVANGGRIQVVSPHELTIELADPRASFPHLLTMLFGAVVPHEAVDYYGEDFGRHPVGSGPFRLQRWLSDQRIELASHPAYGKRDAHGRRLPYLHGLQVRFLGSPDTELLEFRAGNLDLVQSISANAWPSIVTADHRVRFAYRPFKVQAVTSIATEFLGINMDRKPLGEDVKLRRALGAAIDRAAIVDGLLNGRAVVARGLLPPWVAGGSNPTPTEFRFDRASAQRLLLESGHPNGQGLPEIELLYNASPTVEQVVTWIQDALGRVGFRIRLSAVSFPEYLARIARGDFDIYRDNFPAEHAAMESFYGIFYGPYRAPPGLNTTRFSDLQYDLFFKRLLQTVEPSDRLVLATRLEGRLADTAPATFLFHPVRYRLVRPEIRRLPLSPLGRTVLERCWKQQAGEQLRKEEPLSRDQNRGSGP